MALSRFFLFVSLPPFSLVVVRFTEHTSNHYQPNNSVMLSVFSGFKISPSPHKNAKPVRPCPLLSPRGRLAALEPHRLFLRWQPLSVILPAQG